MVLQRAGLRIAGVYGLIGTGCILGGYFLISVAAPDIRMSAMAGWWDAIALIVPAGLLIYLIASLWGERARTAGCHGDSGVRQLILVFVVLACAIVLIGLGDAAYTAASEKDKMLVRLRTVADLKVAQISSWLEERRGDAELMRGATFLQDEYLFWSRSGDEGGRAVVMNRLETLRRVAGYRTVMVVDREGQSLLAAGTAPGPVMPAMGETVKQAVESGQVLSTEIYRAGSAPDAPVYVDFIAPLPKKTGCPRHALVLRVDAARFLYPLIQSWPFPSESAETLLIRREGDQVLYLNDLRHRPRSALTLTVPMNRKDVLAVQVLDGQARAGEQLEGMDYRGVSAVGVWRAVPGTDWVLVAKIDRDEILQSVREMAGWVALAEAMALVIAAAVVILLHQRRELRFSKDQHEALAERVRAMKLLDAILEGSSDAIFAKDLKGRYLLLNHAASKLIGKDALSVIGRDDYAVFPPDQATAIVGEDREVISCERGRTFEQVLTIAGTEVTFQTFKGPLRNEDGEVIGLFGIAEDITARKKAHLELQAASRAAEAARRSAEQANDAKTRFLAAASHDLRQPLQGLRLLLSVLFRKLDNPRQAQDICSRMDEALESTEIMLSRLMEFAALESGKVAVHREAVRLDELVRKVVQQNAAEAAAKGLDLKVRLFECVGDTDPVLLERIVRNFVANAIRYTQAGGILVAVRKRGRAVRIEVWDTGIGIPEDKRDEIFDEFMQLGNPERDRSKGAGLGLAIVARTAKLLGHPLSMRSAAGRGSVFAIQVPVVEDIQTGAPVQPAPRGTSRAGHILLVEDDPAQASALEILLEDSGHKVRCAHDAVGAMGALRSAGLKVELILSDYRLPGNVSGVELIRQAREIVGRDIPAILVTGDTQAGIVESAQMAGCLILHKPYSLPELMAMIDMALTRQSPAEVLGQP